MAKSSGSKASPTLEEVKTRFEAVDTTVIDDLIDTIKILLKRKETEKHKKDNRSRSSELTSNRKKPPIWLHLFRLLPSNHKKYNTRTRSELTSKPPMWKFFIQSGATFLSFVNEHMERYSKTKVPPQSDDQRLKVVSEILQQVGQIHWTVAGLSMAGYFLSKIDQMSNNKSECFQLLQYMVDLADHIKNLRVLVPDEEEKLKKAVILIVKGSMMCASQLYSKKRFRFLKSSLDSQSLSNLRLEINHLYPDLQLTVVMTMFQRQPVRVAIRRPDYPAQAVGIEERARQIEELLQMGTKDESFRAVVIYGFGGIGKTYLAKAVYSKVNLNGYNHTRVLMDIDPQKNDIKKMQQQILKDAFPNYNSGREIDLRDQEEGRELLKRAFQEARKPVFLFIDNALRAEDLRELLPEDLERFDKHIRLLLTTRNLNATNMFKKSLLHGYLVKPLLNSDAIKLLCKETENLVHIKDDVDRILKICNGVPLVLKIVGAHLENQGYRADKCSQILNALQEGEVIKEEHLSKCMVDFVFEKFEKFTQEAFLDICCFFNGTYRTCVEYAVGSLALKTLEDAALITIKLDPKYYAPMEQNKEVVIVHDVIKAKGQNMARSTRIRNIQSFEAAVEEKRLEKIKGIGVRLDKKHSSYVLKEEHLNSMSKSLRVFMLGPNISVSGRSKMTFPELRLVYLNHNIPCVPFHLEALQTLAVYRGPLLKEGVSIYKLSQSLCVITTFKSNVEYTNWEQSNPMQVATNSSLKELYMVALSMKTVPEGLQSFFALKILNLHYWHEMEELPEVICGLHWLSKLSLRCCPLKCLPPSFGKLTSLTHLALNGCDRLEKLPSTLVKLKALRYLNLRGCTSLKELPSSFGELTALEALNLRKCSSLEDLPEFERLGLKYLNVQYCPMLRRDFSNAPKDLQIEDKGRGD